MTARLLDCSLDNQGKNRESGRFLHKRQMDVVRLKSRMGGWPVTPSAVREHLSRHLVVQAPNMAGPIVSQQRLPVSGSPTCYQPMTRTAR
jgi:hypothetical protein